MIQKGLLSVCFMILFFVQGCGYAPLYEKGANGERVGQEILQETSAIDVKPVRTRESKYGIILRNNLENNLAPLGKKEIKKYALYIVMQSPIVIRRGLKEDGSASVGSLQISLHFELKNLDGKSLLKGAVTDYSSFNILDNVYSSEVSKDYAADQLMGSMADEIHKRILLYMKGF